MKMINILSILMIAFGMLYACTFASASASVEPLLNFEQYQELSMLVDDAELAAAEGVGGRHFLVIARLQQWGIFFSGASWQLVRFAQNILKRGWK